MSVKWANHESGYAKLQPAIKDYAAKACAAQAELFLKHYKACTGYQDKMPPALIAARKAGVDGSSLSDFRKDKGFNDAYKALDREVDALWKEQVKLRQMCNEAKQTVNDLKILIEHIEEERKAHAKELAEGQDELKNMQAKAKAGKGVLSPATIKLVDGLEKEFKKLDPGLAKLLKEIEADIKDLTEAGGIYRKQVDPKMETYAAKFVKMIEKVLDLAPKPAVATAANNLPDILEEGKLKSGIGKTVVQAGAIKEVCAQALDEAKTDRKAAVTTLKAVKIPMDQMKKFQRLLLTARKKFAKQIKEAKNGNDLEKQFKVVDTALKSTEELLIKTTKAIASMG